MYIHNEENKINKIDIFFNGQIQFSILKIYSQDE